MDYGLHDFIGNLGVALVLGSYLLLQAGRVRPDGYGYGVVNALGALLIGYSLLFDFNLSSFIIEVAWFLISIYGLLRLRRIRTRTSTPPADRESAGH